MTEIEQLQADLRAFRDARGWKKYHTPKNLVMALCGECGELAAVFQWLDPDKRPCPYEARAEVADVFIYLVQLADALGMDLVGAAYAKMGENGRKYPAEA